MKGAYDETEEEEEKEEEVVSREGEFRIHTTIDWFRPPSRAAYFEQITAYTRLKPFEALET